MKFVCQVCGYTVEADEAPEKCPVCGAPKEKFTAVNDTEKVWASEHKVGIVDGIDKEVLDGLHAHFTGECTEVGMYLAMSRQADREGYPEIAEAYKRIAYEEADHASRFGEMLGEVLKADTKANLIARAEAEFGACKGKTDIAKRAKQLDYDAIHDSVHEMARDEARHGKIFEGLIKRYFA